MNLLRDIQASLLDENSKLSAVLLKFQYLARKLEDADLENWVKNEIEGYPEGTNLPEYRKIGILQSASFRDSFGNGVDNFLLLPALIKEQASEE